MDDPKNPLQRISTYIDRKRAFKNSGLTIADIKIEAGALSKARQLATEFGIDLFPGLDPTAPVGGSVACDTEVAFQVHADHGVPLLFTATHEHPVSDEAGVVDHHVETAKRIDRLTD